MKDFEKEVYRERMADWRHHDAPLWQIFSILGPIEAFLIERAYRLDNHIELKIMLLFLGFMISLALYHSIIRHRVHALQIDDDVTKIEEKNLIFRSRVEPMKDPFSFTSAFASLKFVLLLIIVALFILFACNLCRLKENICYWLGIYCTLIASYIAYHLYLFFNKRKPSLNSGH